MVPSPNLSPKLINKSIREIPVTISAFNMGILVTPMMIARDLFFRLIMAIQATVPMIVDATEAIRAISRVLKSACKMSLF